MDTDGVNFRHQKQKEKAKKFSYEEAKKKKEAKQHSKKAQVYRANEGETPGKKKSRLKFGEGESVKTEKASVVKKAGSATSAALHREISKMKTTMRQWKVPISWKKAEKVFTGWNREVPDAGNRGHPEREADWRDRKRNRHRRQPVRSRRN